ncbi:hypothetical protein [Mycoplasmopsis agassizii]|uniref:Glycosyl hydrolase family 13 catalytic domain-containing protein n=1 Tax=Mycoplasmopsis agassizii TaxID=33922 RepID=A0ABX4H5M0_9BACT|nr:hypothetical protein [Mycoplasmopsis agassizii]PAF55107.1 hypothetical protein CJF60_00255 [Mycoplasmopsis agassizii]SMC16525.1 glucan 1,6-alpha-glucosidase [Mycoplasmopsis agassizii]
MSKIWYEIKQNVFASESKDKSGSYKGIIKIVKYFESLQIKNLILENPLLNYSDPNLSFIKDNEVKHGTIGDLKELLTILRTKKIKPLVKIDLQRIKEISNYLDNYNNYLEMKSRAIQRKENWVDFLNNMQKEEKEYQTESFFIKTQTIDFESSWSANETIKKFKKIVNFFYNAGFRGIIIHNFEYLYSRERDKILNDKTTNQLKAIYSNIKTEMKDFTVVWESEILNWNYLNLKKLNHEEFFDYLIDTSFASLNKNYKYGYPIYHEINYKKFASYFGAALNSEKNIVALQSPWVSRITSLWGNENSFFNESVRSLLILNLINNRDKKIYFGQEIGLLNMKEEFVNKINDFELNEIKHKLLNNGIELDEFFNSFNKFYTENLNYEMIWNKDQNKNTNLKNIEKINVKSQWEDENSNLNFFKKLVSLNENKSYQDLIQNSQYSFSIKSKNIFLVNILIKTPFFKLRIISNLEHSFQNVKLKKTSKILVSSYTRKKYHEVPKKLEPFETLVLIEKINNSEADFVNTIYNTVLK